MHPNTRGSTRGTGCPKECQQRIAAGRAQMSEIKEFEERITMLRHIEVDDGDGSTSTRTVSTSSVFRGVDLDRG